MRSVLIAAAAIALYVPHAAAAVYDDLREGDKYFDDGNYKRAAAAYDRAIASSPGEVGPEAYGRRAAIYILLKDLDGGLAFVERVKARFPNAPEVLEQEALMLWGKDKKDAAIQVAEKVVKARPQTFSNQQMIGEYYYQRDPVKTAAAYEAYLANRPSDREKYDVMPRIKLGQSYLELGRSVYADGDEARTKQYYEKAGEQFEILQRKHGKDKNATTNADIGLCAVYSGLNRWDQAISTCEKVLQGKVDTNGSVYRNLAQAYLARKQTRKAREKAIDFLRVRKNEARGFMLMGDTFFEDRDWNAALDQYLRAEKALKPNERSMVVPLSIKLGKTYRRLPAPTGAPTNPYLANAIEKLSGAQSANPNSIELAAELGGAYIEAKQDGKALALSDKLLTGGEIAKAPPDQRAALMVINAKALFNTDKLKESRERFEDARKLRPDDVQIKRWLVTVINQQAFKEGKNYDDAIGFLKQALAIEKDYPQTLQNLAVISIERGDCEGARQYVVKLDNTKARDAVVTQRLLGRAYLCLKNPDTKRAAQAFADAEREAKKANAQSALAEIYTEWAPLTWTTDVETTVDRLELAVNVGAQDPNIGPAAKRNLAIALYMRGWKSLKDHKGTEATSDFERAMRDPSVLKGTEPAAFEFSLGLAQLDAGRMAEASKTFSRLFAKGNQASYLKGAYAKDNGAFFTAYANYRSQTGAQRQAACDQLEKLSTVIGGRSRDIAAACFEAVAWDNWRSGSNANANKALAKAESLANNDQKRRITVDKAAMNLGRNSAGELEALNGNPAEALVNLGILYDQMNKPRDAYDAWSRAKAKGYNSPNLQKWIEAKKRIYGY